MADPYERKLVNLNFYHSKIEMKGKIVAVLDGLLENRELQLITVPSRVFSAGTIIELIGTDEQNTFPGGTVNKIAYLAFVELSNGGVLLNGDPLIWNEQLIGSIAGYDDTHMPNHQNTIVAMNVRRSGAQLGFGINDEITIQGFKK